jgi:hypothetical protein
MIIDILHGEANITYLCLNNLEELVFFVASILEKAATGALSPAG